MSLYNMSKEELYSFLDKNYVLSEETKNKLKDEYIDGEVLYEFKEEDYIIFNFKGFVVSSIYYKIKKDKINIKENKKTKKTELILKLKAYGIDNPDNLLDSNYENMELKIGQKKLLEKYKRIKIEEKASSNSNDIDILEYLNNVVGLTKESIKKLDGIKKEYLLNMEENEINGLKIEEKDKIKLKNFIENENAKLNKNKDVIKSEQNISEIEKEMQLKKMKIFEFENKIITMELLYEKLEKDKNIIFEANLKNKITKFNPYKLELNEKITVNIINIENNIFFDFLIGNLFIKDILINPIKAKIEINSLLYDIDIINNVQIDYIIEKNKILKPIFICEKCNAKYSLIFYNFLKHSSCNGIITIKQSVN